MSPPSLDVPARGVGLVNVAVARPTSATAALLTTPDTEGVKVPLAPVPTTDAEGLRARAEAVTRRNISAGLTRTVPSVREGACANVCFGAPVINRPASARATLLLTPDTDARIPETDGENAPLVPAPETEAEGVCALAEPAARPVDPAGLFRAVPCALPDACANDWDVTPDIDWLASERAPLLLTPDVAARAPDVDGVNATFAPVVLAMPDAAALFAEAADWAAEVCGLLRDVFIPEAD